MAYARQIEEAGADALELNIYSIPTDPDISGGRYRSAATLAFSRRSKRS